MTTSWLLGIDFGTSSTVVAGRLAGRPPEIIEIHGERRVPSLVFIDANGRTIVGRGAEALGGANPDRLLRAPKGRLGSPTAVVLGGRAYSIVELVATLLRHVYDEAVRSNGDEPSEVRLTYPASWSSPRREDLVAAATRAGLPNPTLVPEPVAAAIAYASDVSIVDGAHVLVYDLGGGTFDSVALRAEGDAFVIVGRPIGDPHLGGELFDELLMNYIGEQLDADIWENLQVSDELLWQQAAAALRLESRRAKELLSSHEVVQVQLGLPHGIVNRQVSRADLEQLIRPYIDESVGLMQRCMIDAGLRTEDLSAVYLVGGASRSPLVQEIVCTTFPQVQLSRRGDPKAVVALGATHPEIDTARWAPRSTDPGRTHLTDPAVPPPTITPPTPTPTPTPIPPVAPPTIRSPSPSPPSPSSPSPATAGGNGPDGPGPGEHPPVVLPRPQPAGSGRRMSRSLVVAGVLLLAGLIGAVVIAIQGGGSKDSKDSGGAGGAATGTAAGSGGSTGAPPASGATGTPVSRVPSGAGMVAIPAGTYPLGAESPDLSETTRKSVAAAAFSIDVHEVTNREYKLFVDQANGARPLPGVWDRSGPPADLVNHPVRGINFEWAGAYCASLGKRLPSEIEWEVAAAGTDGRRYAWGNDLATVVMPVDRTYEVMTNPLNKSALGVFDLTGNVWEWVADTYDPTKVKSNERVLRGGQNGYIRTNWTRLPIDPAGANSVGNAGFRCAATTVSADAPALVFGTYTRPGDPTVPVAKIRPGFYAYDDFVDPASGWIERSNALWRFGYHPNKYFHVETKQQNQTVVALSPIGTPTTGKFGVSTSAEVEPAPLTEPGGQYEFGIVIRAQRATAADNIQPVSYVALVVNPRAQTWEAYVKNADGTRTRIDGRGIGNVAENRSNSLRIDDLGDHLEFSVNGLKVYNTSAGQVTQHGSGTGFVLNSLAGSNKAHIHFASFGIEN